MEDPTRGTKRAFIWLFVSTMVTLWTIISFGKEIGKQGKRLSRPKVLIGFAFWAILIWYMVS